MAGIIKGSINLSMIPKDKIIQGKKGKYLPDQLLLTMRKTNLETLVPSLLTKLKKKEKLKLRKLI